MAEKKIIDIYVRKNGAEERTISFDRVPEISDQEALNLGFAIDGRSLIVSVREDIVRRDGTVRKGCILGNDIEPQSKRPLMRVLCDVEKLIVAKLKAFNYEVIFN